MRVNRTFLYLGVFLVAIGGVLVAAQQGLIASSTLTDWLRLSPLAIVAIGLALALRRTRFSFSAGMLAAAIPGLVIGGAFAAAPSFGGDCGVRGEVPTLVTQQGAFESPANVSVRTGCGVLTVTTASGNGWQLAAGSTRGNVPKVTSDDRSLSIDLPNEADWSFLSGGTSAWNLTLPTTQIDGLALMVNAGQGKIALPGAQMGRLALTANAAEVLVDASGAASIQNLDGTVNLGLLSIRLPAGSDFAGLLRVSAGDLQVCTPPELGLRITSQEFAGRVTVDGLQQSGASWQSENYASAAHHADLSVTVNLGAVEINPIGGCK